MKILFLIFPLICAIYGAKITTETENTELVPDVTSSLLDDGEGQTTEVERTKKSTKGTKTICYETTVDGKSILQCADEPETSETFSIPSLAPGFSRQSPGFSGFNIPGLIFPSFNALTPELKPSQTLIQPPTTPSYPQHYASHPTAKV